MNEYTITDVSSKTKEWSSSYGEMTTYYVKFEGDDEPIQVNKKKGNPAPSVGEVLTGSITDTEYGKKFKGAPGGGKKGFGGMKRDDAAIKAQWAIGQAVQILLSKDEKPENAIEYIEARANDLYGMVERVKK